MFFHFRAVYHQVEGEKDCRWTEGKSVHIFPFTSFYLLRFPSLPLHPLSFAASLQQGVLNGGRWGGGWRGEEVPALSRAAHSSPEQIILTFYKIKISCIWIVVVSQLVPVSRRGDSSLLPLLKVKLLPVLFSHTVERGREGAREAG